MPCGVDAQTERVTCSHATKRSATGDRTREVARYPDDLVVLPGHSYSGAETTIGREKAAGILRAAAGSLKDFQRAMR